MDVAEINRSVDEELEFHDSGDDSSSSSSADNDEDMYDLSDLEGIDGDEFAAGQEPYKIMSEANIHQRLAYLITKISYLLSVSRGEATLLLLHCNWDGDAVHAKWFTNENEFRQEVGLFTTPIVEPSNAEYFTCGMCSGTFVGQLVDAASCGHLFCQNCWAVYIGRSVQNWGNGLFIRCPDIFCSAGVDVGMVCKLGLEVDKLQYVRYLRISYVNCFRRAKWCPMPGCNHVAILMRGSIQTQVTCNCLYTFCWRCTGEAHQPLTCADVSNWEREGRVQDQKRIIANARKCPQCQLSVVRNGFYKRMQCTRCQYHFCCECLSPWLGGGWWDADSYRHICSLRRPLETEIAEDEARAQVNHLALRYSRYVSLFRALSMDLQAVFVETQRVQREQVVEVARMYRLSEDEVKFVTDAWLQVLASKRTFKWTVVYDYYNLPTEPDQKHFFLYMLKHGQALVDRLYQTATKLQAFLSVEKTIWEFLLFRNRLCRDTRLARNYFESILWAIENNATDPATFRWLKRSEREQGQEDGGGQESDDDGEVWTCPYCSFPNDASVANCDMCHQ